MCLIVFSYRQHPDYPLVLIANRDERHERATAAADFWASDPDILAGRDLEALGTWLGVHRHGRFAAVTNFREGLVEPGERSRGGLTYNFLSQPQIPANYLTKLHASRTSYRGFNLLFGTLHELYYFSNRTDQQTQLSPGLYSLSNHLLNSPWPKAEHAKQQLSGLLQQKRLVVEALLDVLQRREPFPDEYLPNTGISLEMERTLSPPFIVTPEYGTRCTTLLLWHKDNRLDFIELSYHPDGSEAGRKDFQLKTQN